MPVKWIPAQAEWVITSETFANREKVRPETGRETGLGQVGDELTGTYLQRVSEVMTHSAAARTAIQQYPEEGPELQECIKGKQDPH